MSYRIADRYMCCSPLNIFLLFAAAGLFEMEEAYSELYQQFLHLRTLCLRQAALLHQLTKTLQEQKHSDSKIPMLKNGMFVMFFTTEPLCPQSPLWKYLSIYRKSLAHPHITLQLLSASLRTWKCSLTSSPRICPSSPWTGLSRQVKTKSWHKVCHRCEAWNHSGAQEGVGTAKQPFQPG